MADRGAQDELASSREHALTSREPLLPSREQSAARTVGTHIITCEETQKFQGIGHESSVDPATHGCAAMRSGVVTRRQDANQLEPYGMVARRERREQFASGGGGCFVAAE